MSEMSRAVTSTASGTRRKYVVAHFMVGNTYPYTMDDWIVDIKTAHAHGLDGFALNVGCEDWQKDRVSDCYEAALKTKLPLKLFISFDMTSIPSNSKADVGLLFEYMRLFARHPAQLLYEGKALVSTFAGENGLFGLATLDQAWRHVKSTLEQIAPIHLIPSFFIDPTRHPHLASMDGYFNWNGGWPIHLTPESPDNEVRYPKLESDYPHLRHLGGRTFMAAVSPWFFTHYGPDSWNKNWIYRGDDWLFVRRWEQLINMRDDVDIVQVISWNDYGESHYIGAIKGAQPNSEAWVDGYPHEAWLTLNAYFASAFKEGYYPPIREDRIYMWARPHTKEAWASDKVPRPRNYQLTDDSFWVVVMSTAPAVMTLSSSDERPSSFEIPAGVSKLSHQLVPSGTMRANMSREGAVVVSCEPRNFIFQSHPDVYNFNAFVAMSSE